MAKKKAKHQFSVPMRFTFTTHVTVEANDCEEAEQLADNCTFVDDGMKRAELVDWEREGDAELSD